MKVKLSTYSMVIITYIIKSRRAKMGLMPYAPSVGSDQPSHPYILVSSHSVREGLYERLPYYNANSVAPDLTAQLHFRRAF